MKKLILTALTMLCASTLMVQAQTTNKVAKVAKSKLTDEQKTVQKELLAKYDTNKNGKLDKAEKAAMSKEDKDKMAKAGLGPKKKAAAATTPATPAASTTK